MADFDEQEKLRDVIRQGYGSIAEGTPLSMADQGMVDWKPNAFRIFLMITR